jgi:hypothetical protein
LLFCVKEFITRQYCFADFELRSRFIPTTKAIALASGFLQLVIFDFWLLTFNF